MKNIQFMELCIMSGFKLNKMVPWIEEYLEYPDIEDEKSHGTKYHLTNLFRNRATEIDVDEENNNELDDEFEELDSLMRKTDDEIAELLMIDEFFLEKYHSKQRKLKQKENTKKKELELAKNIYLLTKHYFTNPLSLQELARIQIRKTMLKIDFKIKDKIETKLPLPPRLKNYLLFKEFN